MIVISILCLIGCIAIILFGIDFYFYLVRRFCRFHIGRFASQEDWENKVIYRGSKWLKHTPTVKITDSSRYMLIDMVTGKYRSHTIQSWQKGSLILGLQNIKSNEVKIIINTYINSDGSYKIKPTNVDCGLLSYAILKNSNPQKVKKAMDETIQIILNKKQSDGMIAYVNDTFSDERYVDTIGLVCPFLAYYGKIYHRADISLEAVNQLKLFSTYGLEKSTLLPNHAFSSYNLTPLGVYGWGRGTAWYIIGLIDTYDELENEEGSIWLYDQIKLIANTYKKYQRNDGGFGYILQMEKGYDSSVTAVMAYFYLRCYEIFNEDKYKIISEKCINKLKTVTRINGAIDWCQGDTKGIGVFSQTYDIMPFAQGYIIRTLERRKNSNE